MKSGRSDVGITVKERMQILIQGCINNDRESQRLLYRHYYGFGMRVAMRYSSGRDQASEILNDSFLKVFQKISLFDPNTSFEQWFRRIIINTSIDLYRREAKMRYHEDISEASGAARLDPTPTAIDDLSYQDLIELINTLTPGYRAVFNLYVIDGYNHEEIGQMLGISPGTSKSNLSKAREILKSRMASETIKSVLKG